MKYPLWKPLLIVLVVALSALLMYPPEQKLKPGLDLAGGTTLTYDVRLPEDVNDPQASIGSLIDVLSKRVDPTGTRNLVWRQVAGNRIEVSMALATPQAKKLREEYQAKLQSLLDDNLAAGKLRSALRLEDAARAAEIAKIAHGDTAREQQLLALAAAHDRMATAGEYRPLQEQLTAAEAELATLAADAPEESRKPLQDRIASLRDRVIAGATEYRAARQAYDTLEADLLRANVDPSEIDEALKRPVEANARRGETSRAAAMDALVEAHPARADAIREVFAAYNEYDKVRGPLDDPNDLIALLRGSGVLEFRIAPAPGQLADEATYLQQLEERGPRAGLNRAYRWFTIDDLDQFAETNRERLAMQENPRGYFAARGLVGAKFGDDYYILLANTPDAALTRAEQWELTSVYRTRDELGRAALGFSLDAPGGDLLAAVTGPNVNRPMAVLLDNRVLITPNLQGKLGGSNNSITGNFSPQEMDYLFRTVKAGSTEAELGEYPISTKTTGPQLGQDNLRRGVEAAVISLVLTTIFMIVYYFYPGITAVVALLVNMVILLGAMAMFGATFTLPGIAGIVLTIGMAVDANVLVFERMREELERKADLQTAIRLGYEKALSAIVDSNLTSFITCVVLYYTATADIKGFAITLMIGLVATLFGALFVSRVLLEMYAVYTRRKSVAMLPIVFPGIREFFTPNIDWMAKKWIFFTASFLVSAVGVAMVFVRGGDMLDVEFRSGTQVSFTLANDQKLSIGDARDRLTRYANVADAVRAGDTARLSAEEQALVPEVQRLLAEADERQARREAEGNLAIAPVDFGHLADATVVTEGDTEGAHAAGFSVTTLIQDPVAVSDTIKSAFGDLLDTTRPIDFPGRDDSIAATDAVFPIASAALADVLNRPDVSTDVGDYVGGVAIVLSDLSPPATLDDIQGRIRRMRNQPAYESLGHRPFEVVGLDRAPEAAADGEPLYRSVAVVVRDAHTNYVEAADTLRDPEGLAGTEWALVRDALFRDTSLDSVSNFSSQVSKTMQQQAVAAVVLSLAAIIIYIWFRFGGFRYSFGAVVALAHDVTVVIGLLAISAWVYDTAFGRALMLDAFKFNLTIIAALLTIIGYSLNDKIVVFDRIRENRGRLSFATPQIINDSINQTFSRTIITGTTTIFAVIVLYVIGGSAIHGFAFAMLIGIVTGTYSSIAIAAPAVDLASRLFGHKTETRGTLHAPATPLPESTPRP